MSVNVKTIYRVIKNRNFTQVSNDVLHNPKLSLKAKGLMCIMLSLPDTWDFHRDHLVTLSSDGKDSLKAGIKELQIAGHLSISNDRDEKGRIKQWIMEVHETATDLAPQQVYPEVDFPQVDKPQVVNPPFSNTNKNINIKTTTTSDVVVSENLLKLAEQTNITSSNLDQLLSNFSEEKLTTQMKNLSRQKNIDNPVGWIIKAMTEGYSSNTKTYSAAGRTPSEYNPASFEAWDEKKYLRECQEREKLSDPNDWRNQMIMIQ